MLFTDVKLRDLEKFICLPQYPSHRGGDISAGISLHKVRLQMHELPARLATEPRPS